MASVEGPDREIISGADAFGAKAASVIAAAEHTIALLSVNLARRLYAREDLTDALAKFALRDERVQVRILVADARGATAGGNPFLEAARKLPSRIKLRELTPEKRESEGPEILIADRTAMLELPDASRLDATFYPHATQRTVEKMKAFDAAWEEAEAVVELSGMRL
jgi:hypothetical protein